MQRTVLLFLLFNFVQSFYLKQENKDGIYCYANDTNPYKYYATKTIYDFVRGNIHSDLLNCESVQFWSINRHGTRLMSKRIMEELQKLKKVQKEIVNNYQNEINDTSFDGLCKEDLELIENWAWNNSITEDKADFLTSQGWKELKEIAIRNKNSFPELLAIPYSENDFLFRFTRSERTESSFKAYAEGLFDDDINNVHGISVENDTLIQTYKYCNYWIKNVDQNPETFVEYYKFRNSSTMKQLISEVSARLKFKSNLSYDVVEDMYTMCKFEQAWYPNRKSNWCAVFLKRHLEVFEYAEDLMFYYAIGHGVALNKKAGCMPLKDLINRFSNIVYGMASEPKSVHYFTHTSALELLMAAMNMDKDAVPLTADNMELQKNRLWRTSIMGPFAANINAILYKCLNGDQFRVEFYLNERKYEFPGCTNGVCSWNYLEEMFGNVAKECNINFCENGIDIIE